MPTFYDPIELEDIDIENNAASFYIVHVGDGNYKFCATTQNLDSPNMRAGDPETRARTYWPITREQLNQPGVVAALFPATENNKIRTSTMKVDELERIFHFNPIEQQQRVFGQGLLSIGDGDVDPNELQHNAQSITWETILPEDASEQEWETWETKMEQYLTSQGIPLSDAIEHNIFNPVSDRRLTSFFIAIRDHIIPVETLHGLEPKSLYSLMIDHEGIIHDMSQGKYTTKDYIDLLNAFDTYAHDQENAHADTNRYFGVGLFYKFRDNKFNIANNFIEGIKNNCFSYTELFDALLLGSESTLSRIHAFKECMPAVLNGETTLEALKNLTTDELKTAVETSNYPSSSQNRM